MKFILLSFCCFLSILVFSQKKSTFSGTITDAENNSPVIGAQIHVLNTNKGTTSDINGHFTITLPNGKYDLKIVSMGYEKISFTINLSKDKERNFALSLSQHEVDEVVVSDKNPFQNTESTEMGTIRLDIEQMKTLPAFLGEVDIINTLKLLPGVSSVNQGSQGFYVRGGGPDQNLVLMDGSTVYNASHLFGFFSVFNADAVKSVTLIKGGIPAEYGGRLASVLKIGMKEGNDQRFGLSGGIGLLSSRLTLEGPLKKNKGAFIISGRRTYIDLFMKAFVPKTSNFYGSSYMFYDLNAKLDYQITRKDKIFISGYFGKDQFSFNNKKDGFNVKMPWGNATGVVNWSHVFGKKLFMDLTGVFSDYNFQFKSDQDEFKFNMFSGVRDVGGKLRFRYKPAPRHDVRFGATYTYHMFTPTSVSAKSEDVEFNTGDIQKIYSHEGAIYARDDFSITEWWKVNLGLRYSWYLQSGPFTRFVKTIGSVEDSTIKYPKGKPIQFYHGIEPRANMRFLFKDHSSLKLGFNYINQYVQLASLSAVSLPMDVWFPSTSKAKPQKGWQASMGYFRNFFKGMIETSVEIYYKGMKNLVMYKNGALPQQTVNDNPDNLLTFGTGRSYGIEFFIKKSLGKFTGWIGYTLAKTERLFPNIQQGWFPAKYDRRHDLSVVASYKLNERWTFGAVFVYATGNTLTLPVSWYLSGQNIVYEYGERNSTRMAPYHRLDISATWYDKPTRMKRDKTTGEAYEIKKRFRNSLTISVYNVYNRHNPFFIYVDNDGTPASGDFKISLKQVSLFPIIPSITWNFKF